jgi:hypothetical protein
VTLPNATRRSFWLNGSAWDFPDFENAEMFVKRLVQAGSIVADRTVAGAVRGDLQNVTTRTEQRHVLQVTGLTLGAKGNRVIAVVVDPVARSGLTIVAVAPTFYLPSGDDARMAG